MLGRDRRGGARECAHVHSLPQVHGCRRAPPWYKTLGPPALLPVWFPNTGRLWWSSPWLGPSPSEAQLDPADSCSHPAGLWLREGPYPVPQPPALRPHWPSPRILLMLELCMSGKAWRIFLLSSLAHTMKAFMGRLM